MEQHRNARVRPTFSRLKAGVTAITRKMDKEIYVMNCLECSMSPAMDVPNTATADCAYCGAGVCLDHARVVTLQSNPVGVVPAVRTGARRITCTTCYSAGGLEGEKAGMLTAAGPRAGATGAPARTSAAARPGR
jgi:hypothetical protein